MLLFEQIKRRSADYDEIIHKKRINLDQDVNTSLYQLCREWFHDNPDLFCLYHVGWHFLLFFWFPINWFWSVIVSCSLRKMISTLVLLLHWMHSFFNLQHNKFIFVRHHRNDILVVFLPKLLQKPFIPLSISEKILHEQDQHHHQ